MEIQAATSVIHLEHVAGTARFVAAGVSSQIPVEDVEMNASDTPRIDVQTFTAKNVHHLDKAECHSVVTADFARTLERELGESKRTVDMVWNALGIKTYDQAKPFTVWEHVQRCIADRDQWKECATELQRLLMLSRHEDNLTVAQQVKASEAFSKFSQLSQQQEGEGKK